MNRPQVIIVTIQRCIVCIELRFNAVSSSVHGPPGSYGAVNIRQRLTNNGTRSGSYDISSG